MPPGRRMKDHGRRVPPNHGTTDRIDLDLRFMNHCLAVQNSAGQTANRQFFANFVNKEEFKWDKKSDFYSH